MPNNEAKNNPDPAQATDVPETLNEETEQEETRTGNWREVFRTAFERARARGLEDYTLTNLGTKPFWVFIFSNPRIGHVIPDPSDAAFTHYVGKDRSDGIKVDPGGTFKFQYLLTTPRRDLKPEHRGDPDFGLQTFRPNIVEDLRQGPKITSHPLPDDSGTVTPFHVKVVDPKTPTPEPTAVSLVGISLAVLIGIRIAFYAKSDRAKAKFGLT